MDEEEDMIKIDLIEFQRDVFDCVNAAGKATKQDIAEELDDSVHRVNSTVMGLLNAGVLVETKTNTGVKISIRGGVKIGDGDTIFVPPRSDDNDTVWEDYTPEEMVALFGNEGMDELKRRALTEALANAPGVGKKSAEYALHLFEADEDIRRDPTHLLSALKDSGIKDAILNRIVREVFLVEKKYSEYNKQKSTVAIPGINSNPERERDLDIGFRAEDFDHRKDYGRGGMNSNRRFREAGFSDHGMDDPPWWVERLLNNGSHSDPEKKRMADKIDELESALHEKEIKVAITDATSPLMERISNLESRKASAGTLTDAQYKAQTEKEIFEDLSGTIESTIGNAVKPIIEAQEVQVKLQTLNSIRSMEKADGVPAGTYLKYMSGEGEEVTQGQVNKTIDYLKEKASGGK